MNPRIAKWNARYADHEPGALPPPSAPLPTAVAGVPAGRALDLACGPGRHAVWLAQRGWRVDAVDGSEAAIALLLANGEHYGCRERLEPHVADLEADPPAFSIARDAYDLIVDCHFLHRPLFTAIREGVRPCGLFVAALHLPASLGVRGESPRGTETGQAPGSRGATREHAGLHVTEEQQGEAGCIAGRMQREFSHGLLARGHGYVLRPGELRGLVAGWRWSVLHAAERAANPQAADDLGVAEIIARRPAGEPAVRA